MCRYLTNNALIVKSRSDHSRVVIHKSCLFKALKFTLSNSHSSQVCINKTKRQPIFYDISTYTQYQTRVCLNLKLTKFTGV